MGGPVILSPLVTVTLDSCKVIGNNAGTSDILAGDFNISNCEITGNTGRSMVNGYYHDITDTTISNNMGRGVSVPFGGELTITDSTISGNMGTGIFLGLLGGRYLYSRQLCHRDDYRYRH